MAETNASPAVGHASVVPAIEPSIIEPMAMRGPDEPDATTRSRSNFRIFAIMVALYLALFVGALDQMIVSTAIPTMTSQLGSAAGYTWIGGAYLLAKVAVMPIWSKLSDIWGRKPILLANLVLFFLSSIVCATAQTMAALIAGRALQGVGGGGLMQMVYITIADMFSLRRRNLFIGLTELIWAVAAGVGPVLGGALAQHASWRWIFWLNLPVSGAAFGLALLYLDVHDPRTPILRGLHAVDWWGGTAMLGLTTLLLVGLTLGGDAASAWSSAKVICLLVFGTLLAGAFLVSEHKLAGAHPIVPLRLFAIPGLPAALAAGAAQAFVAIGAEYYLPLYLQSARLASPTASGVLILPLILSEAATATVAGLAIHRTGEYKALFVGGMVLATAGVAAWAAPGVLDASTPLRTLVGVQVLAGAGLGLGFETPVIGIQAAVPQADAAAATATLGLLRNLANALSVVVGGVVFQNGVRRREGELLAAGVSRELAAVLAGPEAAANVEGIRRIADGGQRWAVRNAFADGLRDVWILYACVAGAGVLASVFVRRSVLSEEHTETKTGLGKQEDDKSVGGAATAAAAC
ncbi:mfs transporter [Diplodia corticola]|uniref:Mfs transporter n=1 Tax=Diplodia corticola TaxID=236234 RepID=A0A1J9QW62_9PEZI|nr:mfs transporter [Diplodia corticola]OJD32242.1 mfs transporter [Diplodia corticola]